MRDYKKLLIWQRGMEIASECFSVVSTWPSFEKYSLGNQMVRAAVSIPSNVAEGNSRTSNKDKKRFIELALGSAYELETQVILSQNLGCADKIRMGNLIQEIKEEQKLLSGFIRLLNN